jgi:hypothetical protein
MSFPKCQVCNKPIKVKGTGRKPRYCLVDDRGKPTSRCKESARRERDRTRHQFSRENAKLDPAETVYVDSEEDAPLCRVCEVNAAEVGPPGNPILCQPCARA